MVKEVAQSSTSKTFPYFWLLMIGVGMVFTGVALYVVKAVWFKFDPYSGRTDLTLDLATRTDPFEWMLTAGTNAWMAGLVIAALSAFLRWRASR